MELLQPHNVPFLAALVLMALLAVSQVVGLGDFLEGGDADIDVDGAEVGEASDVGFLGGLLSLVGVGRVPFLIWLALLLFGFAAIGISLQALAADMLGEPLHPALAAVLSGIFALPIVGVVSRPLAAILPRDRTSAVPLSSLVGREALIQIGTARAGSPARARVIDIYGQAHYVMVEPMEDVVFKQGDKVLLVESAGATFKVIEPANPNLGQV